MGKLPKELREKLQRQKSLRSQGTASMKPQAPAGKAMNRQMRRRMQQQGVEGMDQIEAKKVIIQTDDEDIIIDEPQVIKLNQQGMEIFQVIGKSSTKPSGSYQGDDEEIEDAEFSEAVDGEAVDSQDGNESGALNVQITEQDIQLVAMQTGVSPAEAEAALKDANGDLARAIINLKTR
jgi:nascent polypeptide-associated complex subunit alpha